MPKAAADTMSKRTFSPGLNLLGAVALCVVGAANVGSTQYAKQERRVFNERKACHLVGEIAEIRTGPI